MIANFQAAPLIDVLADKKRSIRTLRVIAALAAASWRRLWFRHLIPRNFADRYRIIRGALYKGLSAGAELSDSNSLALLAGSCTKTSGIAGD